MLNPDVYASPLESLVCRAIHDSHPDGGPRPNEHSDSYILDKKPRGAKETRFHPPDSIHTLCGYMNKPEREEGKLAVAARGKMSRILARCVK